MVFTHLSELSSPTWNTHFPTSEKIHESPFRHYLCLCVWHYHYCVCVVCFPQGKIIICHRCNRYVHKFSLFFLFLSFSSSSICCIFFYLCSSSFYSPTCRIRSFVFCPGRQFQMATFFSISNNRPRTMDAICSIVFVICALFSVLKLGSTFVTFLVVFFKRF